MSIVRIGEGEVELEAVGETEPTANAIVAVVEPPYSWEVIARLGGWCDSMSRNDNGDHQHLFRWGKRGVSVVKPNSFSGIGSRYMFTTVPISFASDQEFIDKTGLMWWIEDTNSSRLRNDSFWGGQEKRLYSMLELAVFLPMVKAHILKGA